jgi:hypothetical protein
MKIILTLAPAFDDSSNVPTAGQIRTYIRKLTAAIRLLKQYGDAASIEQFQDRKKQLQDILAAQGATKDGNKERMYSMQTMKCRNSNRIN